VPHSDLTLRPLVRKLSQWAPLNAADESAILALPYTRRRVEPGHYVIRQGDRPGETCLLLSGFVYRQKVVGNGGRQILSVHMTGDLFDLQNALLGSSDHNVQTLTQADIAAIPREALLELATQRASIGLALWHDTLVDAAIQREWIANLGRRNARVRTSHLLCEFGVRLQSAGLGRVERFELPMTQEDMADALGLTPVHVNRTLKALSRDGLVDRRRKSVYIQDWRQLAQAGDFRPDYLHLEDLVAATACAA
jgi:CRP-like cAMP-binding protein